MNLLVFFKYNGRWNKNNVYIDNESMGVFIPMTTSYVGLLEILFEALGLSLVNHSMVIKYTFEVGCCTVRILNDHDINLFRAKKK